MVAVNFALVGCLTGFILPIFFVTTKTPLDPDNDSPQNIISGEHIRSQVKEMMLTMAIVHTVFLFVVIFFYNSPNHGEELGASALDKMPLQSLEDVMSHKEPTMMEQMREASKNRNFMFAMMSSSLMVSITYCFPTIME